MYSNELCLHILIRYGDTAPRYGAYRYTLLINICSKNPMFCKYDLHNLHGQSVQSHFLAISLNWTRELICLKFSAKLDHNGGDLQFKVSRPTFIVLFLYVANSWKFIRLYMLFLLSKIKSITGTFRLFLFYNSQPPDKYLYCFVTVYQSHLRVQLVLISEPAHEFCWSCNLIFFVYENEHSHNKHKNNSHVAPSLLWLPGTQKSNNNRQN